MASPFPAFWFTASQSTAAMRSKSSNSLSRLRCSLTGACWPFYHWCCLQIYRSRHRYCYYFLWWPHWFGFLGSRTQTSSRLLKKTHRIHLMNVMNIFFTMLVTMGNKPERLRGSRWMHKNQRCPFSRTVLTHICQVPKQKYHISYWFQTFRLLTHTLHHKNVSEITKPIIRQQRGEVQ